MEKDSTSGKKQFLVVGIGASAGGLDAFKQLIKAIPVDSGMAYILVQHLDPAHESILSELLQKVTLIPVHEVIDEMEVEPDHIYVIPPNKLLTANNGMLNLTDRSETSHRNLPIDIFFTSLAAVHQSNTIGVVLSGTGKDGTLGLKAIKQKGGITFAQHHHTAGSNEMPQSAINANVVDFVLPPEGIVQHLIDLSDQFHATHTPEKAVTGEPDDVPFNQILTLLDQQKGVDFTYYKHSTIRRRIARRMDAKNLATFADYLEYLKVTPGEIEALFMSILIPVTDFFRDAQVFNGLSKTVLPGLVKHKKHNESLRAWSVGCSTGQEAYSLAILLCEFLSSQAEHFKIQVFATDISEVAIAYARAGYYTAAEVAGVTPERLDKFFTKTDNGYHVNKNIRDLCVFAVHNIISSPPFASIDLILCRNMLIYMDTFLQRKAMATFHYALNEKGVLFLGKSESVGNSSDLFRTLGERDKTFARNAVPGRFVHLTPGRRTAFIHHQNDKSKDQRPNDDYQKNADDVILQNAPAGVIVNERFEILQFRGSTGDWLESPPGKPIVNILRMVKGGLAVDVRNAIYKAKTSRQPFRRDDLVLDTGETRKLVSIEVIPLLKTISLYYLVLFRNTGVLPKSSGKGLKKKQKASTQKTREVQLEHELTQTREDMRTITEDQEAGIEELLSANEDLLSGSEELRSLNEELEISKEELQSTVEELSVSNQELSIRNDELTYARKYAEAIVTTVSEPLVVLNQNMQIKSVNMAYYAAFNTQVKDTIGHFFNQIDDGRWNIPELMEGLSQTFTESNFQMRHELKHNVKHTGERVFLLKARKIINDPGHEDLILLAIEDITDRRTLEASLQSKADYAKAVLDSSPVITRTASLDGAITYANKFFLEYSGISLEDALSRGYSAIIHPDYKQEALHHWNDALKSGKEFYLDTLIRKYTGEYRWHRSHAVPIRDAEGNIGYWISSAADIHDQKMFADELERQIRERTLALKNANNELEHSNKNLEQFAFIASHDLQEPLRKIKTFASMVTDNYTQQLPAEGKRLVEKIHSSSDRLSSLIRDVLHFSRIDHAQNKFVKTDITSVLYDVIADFEVQIEERQAVIKVSPLPTVAVIPVQIGKLFYNLLSNSLKFCDPTEPPSVNVSSRKLTKVEIMKYPELTPNLTYFEILFADNGIGFNEKYKEKIFDIFQRLHGKDEYPGTGIGLALCKKIVQNHKGLIFAESHEEAGALFHIILPLADHHTTVELLPGYGE